MDLIIIITLLVTCYFTGKLIEKNHYKNIKKRELLLIRKPYVSFAKKTLDESRVQSAQLVAGSVVLGCDYFRTFLASLRNVFGGNVSTFESLLDRGRREALLRVREEALKMGADIVINVKFDSTILDSMEKSKKPKTCVTAYGTAIKYAKR